MTRRIFNTGDDSAIPIFAGVTVLAFPPLTADIAVVPDEWNVNEKLIPQFDLSMWASASTNLSLAELFGGQLHDLVIADDDVDVVDFATNTLDITTHAYNTGDGPLQLTTTGTLPTGLALLTDYYVIYMTTGTIALATTLANALAGTKVAFTDVGVGTHTIIDVATTKRMHWQSFGLLGDAKDGYIPLTAIRARIARVSHVPSVRAYAVKATLSAANAVYGSIYPVVSP